MKIEDRLDYYDILDNKVTSFGYAGYECLVCGRKIVASAPPYRKGSARGLGGNARGAMTNHIKAHMRRGEV